jgi:threonine/homoserine/homoserine lactone efflux protein
MFESASGGMHTSNLLIFALAITIYAISPGPGIAALVARTLARGVREILPFLAALWAAEIVWLSFGIMGITVVEEEAAPLLLIVKWLGVFYLLYLAWRMWITPLVLEGPAMPVARPWRMFMAGLAVAFGNPKAVLFYVSVLPTILDLSEANLLAWTQLAVTMLVVLAVVNGGYVLLAARARRMLTSPNALRLASRGSAGLMAAAALLIATR